MVYNAYSYRRWMHSYEDTKQHFLWDKFGIGGGPAKVADRERAVYDDTLAGDVAPETVFTSASQIERMTRRWSRIRVRRENIAAYELSKNLTREDACRWLGPICGLDLYCRLQK